MNERAHVDVRGGRPRWTRRWQCRIANALALLAVLLLAAAAAGNDFGKNAQGGKAKQDDPGAACNDCPCESATAPGNAPSPQSGGCSSTTSNNAGIGGKGGSGGASLGDPVEAFTGRYRYQHLDLELNGVLPIRMIRRYDSQSRYDSPLGFGWAFDYDVRLYEYADGSVIVRSAFGQREHYVLSGNAYLHEDDARGRAGALTAVGNGYELRYPSGHVAVFDAEGMMTRLRDAQGNYLAFSYQGDPPVRQDLMGISPYSPNPNQVGLVARVYRLTRVEEFLSDDGTTGRYVTLAYDSNGRLDQIQSFDGRVVDYDYVEATQSPTFRGNLAKVTDAEGIEYVYAYEDSADFHNLTSVQEGQGTTALVNVYDAQDRVVTQGIGPVMTAQRRWTLAYGAPNGQGERTTTVTRRIVDENGQNERFAVTTLKFNAAGHVIQKIDDLGHRLSYARTNAAGTPTLERPEKITITTEYNGGTVQSPSYTTERVVTLMLDANQNITSRVVTTNGETITETWTYDHDWVKTHQRQTTRYSGEVFLTTYAFIKGGLTPGSGSYNDALPPENIHSITREAGGSFTDEVTTFTYDAVSGQISHVQLPDVGSESVDVVRTYHTSTPHRGLLDSVELEVNGSPDDHLARSFDYDARALLSVVTDANGKVTDVVQDDLGRVVEVTRRYRDESAIPIVEDAETTTVYSYTGPNDHLSDSQLEMSASWYPGHHLTRVEVGRTASEGHVRRMIYDPRGRIVRIERKDPVAAPVGPLFPDLATFLYDSDDNRVQAADGALKITVFAYDLKTQLAKMTDPANNETEFLYDALGNRIELNDAKERDTLFSYDALSRLISVNQVAEGLETEFEYDAAGNVRKVEDPKDQVTTYSYDGLSRLRTVTQPNTTDTVTYDYDARSRMIQVINARGDELVYDYAPWGGLESVLHDTDQDGDIDTGERLISHTYDDNGNLLTTSDSQIQTGPLYTFSYDPQNRVDDVTVEYLPGSTDPVLDSQYDATGHRSALLAADGTSNFDHRWQFDALDRLVAATLPGGPTPTLAFGYNGRDDVMTLTRRNATPADYVQTTYTYFDQGPVDTITVADLLPSSAARLLLDYAEPDAVLNVEGVSETRDGGSAQAYDYEYDGVDRLTEADYPSAFSLPADETFSYDDAGNRDNAGFGYDVNNRIEESPGRLYQFDADGNLEAITDDATPTPNPIANLIWDFGNRLQEYENVAVGKTATYRYDPFGRRILKEVDDGSTTTTTFYLWDGDQLLAEYDGSGVRQTRYAYAGGFAPVQMAKKNGTGEDVYDVHSDHLDTPRMLTDSTGVAVWRASYQAYGSAKLDPANTVSDFNVRFPGQYYDAESETAGVGSGWHYNRHRYYAPDVGGYVSGDPIGQWGGVNTYVYAANNPVSFVDPYALLRIVFGTSSKGGSYSRSEQERIRAIMEEAAATDRGEELDEQLGEAQGASEGTVEFVPEEGDHTAGFGRIYFDPKYLDPNCPTLPQYTGEDGKPHDASAKRILAHEFGHAAQPDADKRREEFGPDGNIAQNENPIARETDPSSVPRSTSRPGK
jgi:RHS repeat-associated protein